MSWVECIVDNDYEIFTEYPYPIRRIGTDNIIKESIHKYNGYIRCFLNQKTYQKHIIIAKQFIKNDDPINKNQVDHIDRNQLNNDINNLRWVSPSENCRNRSSHKNSRCEYFDNIDDDCILVDVYGKHQLEDYYYDEKTDTFYLYNGVKYRKLKINYTIYNKPFVCGRDINNKNIRIFYSRFKKQYNLI